MHFAFSMQIGKPLKLKKKKKVALAKLRTGHLNFLLEFLLNKKNQNVLFLGGSLQ